MILKRYLLSEVGKTFLAIFIVIFLILLSTQLLRILTWVTDGRISLDLLFMLVALKNLESLSLIFPLALFLGIILAFSRFYKDNEMVAMQSCGIGPQLFFKSLFPFIILLLSLEVVLVVFVNPWANIYVERVKQVALLKADIELLDKGRFTILSQGKKVIYVEDIDQQGLMKNVFIRLREGDNNHIIFSHSAKIQADPKTSHQYIVLNQGYRYDGIAGSDSYQVMNFHEYGVLMEPKTIPNKMPSVFAQSLRDLWNNKQNLKSQAELQWRISMILSVLILSFLAVPLSKTTPRKGRYARVLPAIIIYFMYFTLLKSSQGWIRGSDFPFWLGLWWVHLAFLTLAFILYAKQLGWLQRRSVVTI